MKVGLAQVKFPKSAKDGLDRCKKMLISAREQQCDIVCFPESVIPGLRGVGFEVEEYNHSFIESALTEVCSLAKEYKLSVILPTEWKDDSGYHLVAFVIDRDGEVLGYQTKNQIDPDEDFFGYVPGKGRQLFEINGVKFGIAICHEGWRYPETVRWAAYRGASIVFHPQFTGVVANPEFYQGAMVARSVENNIYFASVNFALEGQGSTTTLISPTGEKLASAKENVEQLLICDVNPESATRLLATRFHPELYA